MCICFFFFSFLASLLCTKSWAKVWVVFELFSLSFFFSFLVLVLEFLAFRFQSFYFNLFIVQIHVNTNQDVWRLVGLLTCKHRGQDVGRIVGIF
jgi:hypothetical protein